MPITNCGEVSVKATQLLKDAIAHEVRGSWMQAASAYRRLTVLVSYDNLPTNYVPTDEYRLMLYEVYDHLGVAYQHLGEHNLAINSFSGAIDVFKKTMAGLSVGFRSVDWLLLPVLCKRAISCTLLDNYRGALRDVTRAKDINADNMDMLCCEVLILNTLTEYERAMKLLVKGLAMNKLHDGCRLLRLTLKAEGHPPLVQSTGVEGVNSVKHPAIIEFIERHLPTLSVPHTIYTVDLSSATSTAAKHVSQNMAKPIENRVLYDLSWKKHSLSTIHPFRCGALPALFERDPVHEEEVHIDKHRRREQYSGNLREHASKMRFLTHDQFAQLLEKNQSRKRLLEWKIRHEQHRKVGETITISAFKPINTQDVPRQYIKPWLGDRLLSAPLPVRQEPPIFYPSYS